MSFEKFLEKDMEHQDFGAVRYVKVFKTVITARPPLVRQHISKSKVEEHQKGRRVGIGETYSGVYDDKTGIRYLVLSPLVFDAFLSVYDFNTGSMVVHRWYRFVPKQKDILESAIVRLKRRNTNLEARLVGMQNGQPLIGLKPVVELLEAHKIPIVEIDLFGTETRHIALDHKLGTSLDIFLEDRLYRPGELSNALTLEQFERSLMPVMPVDALGKAKPGNPNHDGGST